MTTKTPETTLPDPASERPPYGVAGLFTLGVLALYALSDFAWRFVERVGPLRSNDDFRIWCLLDSMLPQGDALAAYHREVAPLLYHGLLALGSQLAAPLQLAQCLTLPLIAGVLACAAVATGHVDGLFFEVHPDPASSPSDGPNMVPLAEFPELLDRLLAIHRAAV